MKTRVAAFVSGPSGNVTRVTPAADDTAAGWEWLASLVRQKEPGRDYHICEVRDGARGLRRVGEAIGYWHVGDGFSHEEGWFVE